MFFSIAFLFMSTIEIKNICLYMYIFFKNVNLLFFQLFHFSRVIIFLIFSLTHNINFQTIIILKIMIISNFSKNNLKNK